jgi:hypothetical protein
VLIVVAAVAALLLSALLGGRLARLAEVRLRGGAWLAVALLVQTVALLLPPGWTWPARVGHVGSYLLAGCVLVANRRLPGVLLVGLGGLANGLAIAVNGGTLPADPDALARAGVPPEGTHALANSGVLEHPRLAFLGDVFAVPAQVPFANVFSVGDVLVVAGVLLAALSIGGTWWSPPREIPPEFRFSSRPSPATGPPAAPRCRPGRARPGRRPPAGGRNSPPPASPSAP